MRGGDGLGVSLSLQYGKDFWGLKASKASTTGTGFQELMHREDRPDCRDPGDLPEYWVQPDLLANKGMRASRDY